MQRILTFVEPSIAILGGDRVIKFNTYDISINYHNGMSTIEFNADAEVGLDLKDLDDGFTVHVKMEDGLYCAKSCYLQELAVDFDKGKNYKQYCQIQIIGDDNGHL